MIRKLKYNPLLRIGKKAGTADHFTTIAAYKMTLPPDPLPKEYKHAEYLESTGTQYIELPVYWHNRYVIEVTAQYTDPANYNQIFGPYYYYGNSAYPLTVNNITNLYVRGGNQNEGTRYNTDLPYNVKFKYVGDSTNKKITITTDTAVNDYLFSTHIYPDTDRHNMGLFCSWNTRGDGGLFNLGKGRIFEFKFTRDGVLSAHLLPAVRKADGVAGMYDIVTRTFYTNDGTGEFITDLS